ncbi:MAG: phosphopantetheine-binding protein [Candidatus Omnitrophica bacterium]|nr:phosphopantetheine-binding protein [Candidatus Omnitrophota bacterium]
MNAQELEEKVKEVVASVIGISADKLPADADFARDLDVDSMKAIEITGAIEKTFKIIIPEEEIRKIRTLNQAITLTKQLLNIK